MVGFLLKKANLSTPHRPSTCAAIFLFVDAASLWRAEIVKASLPEVNQFTGNCFRMVRIVLKITFLGLRYPGQRPECPSLSYYGSCLYSMCFKGEFQCHFEGFCTCFTDLSRTTCALKVWVLLDKRDLE